MSERDFSVKEPVYEPDVHPEVARECLEAWRKGRPWTQIRVLEKGVDNPSGQSCGNSQGKFDKPCSKPVEAVQYTSAFGSPHFFCEEHALDQNEWDKNFYDGEVPVYDEDPDAVEGESVADQVKRKRKKDKLPEPEQEEYDP